LAGYEIYQNDVDRKIFRERHLRPPRERHNSAYDDSDEYTTFRNPILQSYLGNNDPPSDFDESSLRNSLFQVKSEISSIQRARRLTRSFSDLQRLKRTQQDLERICNDYEAVLSPVRFLPPEVLTLIFDMARELRRRLHWQQDKCEDEYLERNEDSSPRGRRPDIFLEWREVIGLCAYARVCGRWRAAALNKPSLWTSFAINFEGLALQNDIILRDPLSILRTVLSRAREYPLNFTFTCPSFYPYSGEVEFRTLCIHIRRWNQVTLELRKELFPILENIHPHELQFSSLHSLAAPIDTPMHVSAFSVFISRAHNLDKLEFTYEHDCRHFLSQITLPWGRLTRLKAPMRSCDLAELLYHAPNLQELEYKHISDRRRSRTTLEWAVAHKNLQSLTICNSFGEILKNVQLPSLRKLVLAPIIWPAEKTLLSAASFFELFHCPSELWILDIDATSRPEFLCKLLRSASNVNRLALSFRRISSEYADALVDAMTVYPNHVALPILPNLRHLQLKFHHCTSQAFVNERFLQMVRSRCGVPPYSSVRTLHKLELLTVRDLYGDSPEFPRERLKNPGLEVIIMHVS